MTTPKRRLRPAADLSPTAPGLAGQTPQLSGQLCFTAYAAAHAFTRAYKPLLDPLGLTYPQYLVLLVLWEQDNITVKEIGARLYLDSGTLTPLLKRLESAGFVRRNRDAQDERQVRITLTPKADALKRPVSQAWQQMVCSVGLSPEEFASLKGQLERLRDSLTAQPAEKHT